MDEPAVLTGYDTWAPFYDDRDPSTWLDEPFLLDQLRPFMGCRILDMGCGTGRYLRRLTSGSYHMVALDLSFGMLARARKETQSGQHISWVLASAVRLPFLPQSFDRIMSGLVLDHIADIESFFNQISRVLAPNGRVVLAAVHPQMQRLTGADITVTTDVGSTHISGHIHEVADLVKTAQKTQLQVDVVEEPCVTPAMVAQRPAWRPKLGSPALVLLSLSHG
jgi:malonyl-CoA O-methyltransferase